MKIIRVFLVIISFALFSFSCTEIVSPPVDNQINKTTINNKIPIHITEELVSWRMLYGWYEWGYGMMWICLPIEVNCMSEVVVTGRPSTNEFTLFKNLFKKNKSNISVASGIKLKRFFDNCGFNTFLKGLNSKSEYIDLLRSGTIKIVETNNEQANNLIYIVIDEKTDENKFSSDDALLAVQIIQ
ncbi:MAG: hypothetical protein ROY99_00820 [Ignavibacterium sp.]|jgi:hypothetical protein|nr:hypothetical protein [Ignavibacterium sp.]